MNSDTEFFSVSQLYFYLRQQDNDLLLLATKQLEILYQKPESIGLHVQMYNNSTDPTERQHAIIGLKKSVDLCWPLLDISEKIPIFSTFLELLVNEPVWINRRNLIDLIDKAILPEFSPSMIEFIELEGSNNNEAHLEISLLLSTILPDGTIEFSGNSHYSEFFRSIVERGLDSRQPEVRLASLHFLIHAKLLRDNSGFIISDENMFHYWNHCIEIIDPFVQNKTHLASLTSLISFAISENIYQGNPLLLLKKLLEYFYSSLNDISVLMELYTVVQAICHHYADLIIQESFHFEVLQILLNVAMELFDPDDLLVCTSANFFEPTVTDLCKNEEIVEEMWDNFEDVIESLPGLFVFSRALACTYANAPSFYSKKLNEVSIVLKQGIASNSALLRNSAADSADEFVKYFIFESDELSLGFVHIVLESCRNSVSAELLMVLSRLLDTTKKTDNIFHIAYPFLMDVLVNGSVETQIASIPCLKSLARWSTCKIFKHCHEILNILEYIIKSTSDSIAHLKCPSIDCVSTISSVIVSSFDPYFEVFSKLFFDLIKEGGDDEILISCFQAFESFSRTHFSQMSQIDNQILGIILHYSELDFTSEYLEMLKNPIENDIDPTTDPQVFSVSASSLRLLSCLLRLSSEFFNEYYEFVIHCCEIQSKSYSEVCKIAAAISLGNIVESIPDCSNNDFESIIAKKIGPILTTLTAYGGPVDVNYEGFYAAWKIISYIGYDTLEQYHRILIEQALEFLNNPASQSLRPLERGKDLFDAISDFLRETCISAGEFAPRLLRDLFDSFLKFAQHPQLRFRSLAIQFFSYLIKHAAINIDDSLKLSALSCSITIAETEIDSSGFFCLNAIATSEPSMAANYKNEVKKLFINKLSLPIETTERFILMRDNCVSALATWTMNIFTEEDIDLEDILPIALAAMPIQLEYSESSNVCSFFLWLFERSEGKFRELFLRVLAVLFSNHISVIDLFQLSPNNLSELESVFKTISQDFGESMIEICNLFLDFDEEKVSILLENCSTFL